MLANQYDYHPPARQQHRGVMKRSPGYGIVGVAAARAPEQKRERCGRAAKAGDRMSTFAEFCRR